MTFQLPIYAEKARGGNYFAYKFLRIAGNTGMVLLPLVSGNLI
jgi:hypothetical protein